MATIAGNLLNPKDQITPPKRTYVWFDKRKGESAKKAFLGAFQQTQVRACIARYDKRIVGALFVVHRNTLAIQFRQWEESAAQN